MKIHGALIVVVLALTACVSVQSTRLGADVIRPPVTPDRVSIYRTADQVRGHYEEVALLSAAGDYNATSEEGMYKEMRKKAGAMGANGIILDSVSEPSTGAKIANVLLFTSANRTGKAVAIYVSN